MNTKKILKLEIKNFLSGRAVIAAALFFLLGSAYAIFHGASVIDSQREVIAEIPASEAEHVAKQIELNRADLGNLLYYLQKSAVHEPASWAWFSVGQRDVNPFQVKVKMLTLEGQIYDSEISNPMNLLYGNFDLSFVIVFLLPLLIIALCHNLVSAEQESGIWNLLRSQPVSLTRVVAWRLAIRFVFVFLLVAGALAAGCIVMRGAFDVRYFYALTIAVFYLAFWFALAAFVASLQKSSVFNALSLLGVWIFLTILAPALLNLVVSTSLPVSESFEVTVRQREGYHNQWDQAKRETMRRFYEIYPEYRSVPISEDQFSWGWYYAMNLMGDLDSANSTAQYIEKLRKRDQLTNRAALFLPAVNTQLAFNRLTGNDLETHLEFLDSVRRFHKSIREYFYPYIFREAKVEDVDWQKVPGHAFDNETLPVRFSVEICAVFAFAVIFGALARRNFSYIL